MHSEILIIETTTAKKEQAESIVNTLLNKKLIACANISEVFSIYNWGNEAQREAEYKISCKTLEEKEEICLKEIKELHPYRVPMILATIKDCNQEYQEWVKEKVEWIYLK